MKILIVEDDLFYLKRLSAVTQEYGLIHTTSSANEAKSLLSSDHFDLLITDIDLKSNITGLKLAKIALQRKIPTFILSSHESENLIEEAYELGCEHFLQKNNFHIELPKYLDQFIKHKSINFTEIFNKKFITQDKKIKSDITNLLNSNLKNKTILITGETGVGKTQIAKIFHESIYTKEAPFIHLNCSEVSESLIESELFGHEKGSFTGADKQKKGKLTLAHNGTLFLDEVSSMSPGMQQKLLRAIEEKSYYPIGSTKPIKSNFTLITATCDDLIEMMAQKKFRKDLFFRISGNNLILSPLRDRPNDIKLLIKKFLKISARKIIIKEEAIHEMLNYSWPGNIRELKKMVDQFNYTKNGIIDRNTVQSFINDIFTHSNTHTFLNDLQTKFILENGLRVFIDKIEREITKSVYEKNKGKITYCIKDLKVSTSAFYRMLEKHVTS